MSMGSPYNRSPSVASVSHHHNPPGPGPRGRENTTTTRMTEQVSLPLNLFDRHGDDGNNRRRNRMSVGDNMLMRRGEIVSALRYKIEPYFIPDYTEARKVSKACPCFPGHEAQIHDDIKLAGIRNVLLHIPSSYNEKGYGSLMPGLAYQWSMAKKSYGELRFLKKDEIVQGARMGDQHQKEAADGLILPYSGRLIGSLWLFRLTGWIIRKIFEKLFPVRGISVHDGEVELLNLAHETDLPIVYVPLNRSDLDPFVIFYTLQSLGIRTPYFFSNRTQRFWGQFIGGIGFKLNSKHESQCESRDIRTALSLSTFQYTVKKKASFMMHLESGRSRTGIPSTEPFAIEFMSELISAWRGNIVEDACIVPTSISYDVLPELQEHSHSFSFLRNVPILGRIYNLISNRVTCGGVRVSFGQPFTLREFQATTQNTNTNEKWRQMLARNQEGEAYTRTFLGTELTWENCTVHLSSPFSTSLSSLYDQDLPSDDFETAAFIDALTLHTLHASGASSVPMITHLVSFILLKKYRKAGIEIPQLYEEVKELQKWLAVQYNKDLGYSGSLETAVIYALQLLRHQGLLEYCVESNQVKPRLLKEILLKLSYYANSVLSIVVMETVFAVAILSCIKENVLTISTDFENDPITLDDNELYEEVKSVYYSFSSEFFLHSPCKTFTAAVRDSYDIMQKRDLVQPVEVNSGRRRLYEEDDYEDDDDDAYGATGIITAGTGLSYRQHRINTSTKSIRTLRFLRDLLRPRLVIYAAIAAELRCLINPDNDVTKFWEEPQLAHHILERLEETFSIEDYGEYLTLHTIKTAFSSFDNNEIIQYEVDTRCRRATIHLVRKYATTEALESLANNILHYVTS